MAMEVPVVSTQVAGIPELIESGSTGILGPEKDPEALSTAIEQLLRDPGRRSELARRAGQVVRERFDRERTIWGLVEVFSSRARLAGVSPSTPLEGLVPARGLGDGDRERRSRGVDTAGSSSESEWLNS